MTRFPTRAGRTALALAIAALLALPAAGAAARKPRAAKAAARPDVVLEWYDATTAALAGANIGLAGNTQVTGSRDWAVAWLAASRALRDLGAGVKGRAVAPDAADAAVATAVHDVLVAYLPTQQQQLDDFLAGTLGRLRDGRAEALGKKYGALEAALGLADRVNDGLDVASVNLPFTPPPAAPGIWQPTPPAFGGAVQYGQRLGEPFLLGRAAQFRPGPPPALDSAKYLADLAEVRAVGAADSAVRTPEQLGVARFWSQTSIQGYTTILRQALVDIASRPLAERVRIIALFHAITTDAQIAIYEAKYAYTSWRPVTAIRTGSVDPDPTWTPLIATPAHPDYPSGHTGYAGAAEVALTALIGPRPVKPIAAESALAPGVVRTYADWAQITQDNIDARVWEGIHFRYAHETGADVGRQVARFDLARLAQGKLLLIT